MFTWYNINIGRGIPMKKITVLLILSMLILSACTQKKDEPKEVKQPSTDEIVEDEKVEDEKKEPEDHKPLAPKDEDVTEVTYVRGILIANKKFALPKDFAPQEDSVAKENLLRLLADAQIENLDISDYYSGYRSYAEQEALYENYKKLHGQEEADTFSARPGHSEHQTGLTFDLFHNDGAFLEREPEVTWVAENAHLYGFIVRYQSGKEHITGYQAEPWHLRYIGEEAILIYKSNLTLEQYLNVEGGDYK